MMPLKHSGKCVKLELNKKDREILEDIQKEMKNEIPIRDCKARGRTGESSILYINSKHIAMKLADYGMIPNKSLVLQFPKWLDKKLVPHFLRGYFDGDGSINKSGNGV